MSSSPPRSSSLMRVFSKQGDRRPKTYLDVDQEHAAALEAFKARISEEGLQIPPALLVNDDLHATLYRFLRARKYNVNHAFHMLERSLQWRSRVGADHILERPVDAKLTHTVRECRPSSYIGFDRQHRPIFVERLGLLDGQRMEREGASDEVIISYHLREMEFMAQVVLSEASASAGRTIDRIVTIMDAQGLTLSALTGFAQRLFRMITAMDSDNYPECCHAIYIVNAGATFGTIWRIVSPFVDKGTRDKVHVIGGGRQMQLALGEVFGPERVPSFLGGSLDYEAVRHAWLEKMDAAMKERQQRPRGPQPPVVIKLTASAIANRAQPHAGSPRGRAAAAPSGPLGWLKVNSSSSPVQGDGGSMADADSFGTPMSQQSRVSYTGTMYYDAVESADEAAAAAAAAAAAGAEDGRAIHQTSFGGARPTSDAAHAHAAGGKKRRGGWLGSCSCFRA